MLGLALALLCAVACSGSGADPALLGVDPASGGAPPAPGSSEPLRTPTAKDSYDRLWRANEGRLSLRWDERQKLATRLSRRDRRPLLHGPERVATPRRELARRDVAELAPLIRQRASGEDLKLVSDQASLGRSHLAFQQSIDGVEVFGGQMALHYDAEGGLTSLTSNLVDEAAARALLGGAAVSPAPDTLIYPKDDGELRLGRWETTPDERRLVDLADGAVLLAMPRDVGAAPLQIYSTWDSLGLGCAPRRIDAEDMVGCAAPLLSGCCAAPGNCLGTCQQSTAPLTPLCPVSDNLRTESLVGASQRLVADARTSIQSLESHFGLFGLNSYDNKGGELALFLSCQKCGNSALTHLSAGFQEPQYWVFCSEGSRHWSEALDVMGHEYGHMLLGNLVPGGGLIYDGPSSAIHEGLADVIGILAEAVIEEREPDWLMGESVKAKGVRNISSPESQFTLHMSQVVDCITDACLDNTQPCRRRDRSTGCNYAYDNSTLISHTLYRAYEVTFELSPLALQEIVLRAIQHHFLSRMGFQSFGSAILDACQDLIGTRNINSAHCAVIEHQFELAGYTGAAIDSDQSLVGPNGPVASFSIAAPLPQYFVELATDDQLFNPTASGSRNLLPSGRNYYQSPLQAASVQRYQAPSDVWFELVRTASSDRGRIYHRVVSARGAEVFKSSEDGAPAPFVNIAIFHPSGTLLRDPSAPERICLLEACACREIPGGVSGAMFRDHGFRATHVIDVPPWIISRYLLGRPSSAPAPLQLFRSTHAGDTSKVWAVWYWRDKEQANALVRRPIASEAAFHSWGFTGLAQVPIDDAAFDAHPPGAPLGFRDGSLIKGASSPTVYVVSDQHRMQVSSAEVFEALSYDWGLIETVPDAELALLAGPRSTTGAGAQASESPGDIDVSFATRGAESDAVGPSGYVQAPFAALTGGSQHGLYWYAEDPTSGLHAVDLEFSTDGWQTATPVNPINLMALPHGNDAFSPLGVFDWPVPDIDTSAAELRILMWDELGNFGTAYTPPFSIISSGSGGACEPLEPPFLGDPGVMSPTGHYDVVWVARAGASDYILEEDRTAAFSNPVGVTLAGTSRSLSGKANGTYHYRVKALNDCTESDWSDSVSIEVSVNQAPEAPYAPIPANGSVGVSRTPTLRWSGADAEGPSEYAVRLGTDPSNMPFVQAYSASTSVTPSSPLAAGTPYHWQVRIRDDEGIVTEGPLWSFTTLHSFADVSADSLQVIGDVLPAAEVMLRLDVSNVGSFESEPCEVRFCIGQSTGTCERPLAGSSWLVPRLSPGESTVVEALARLDELSAGTSYVTAQVDSATYFDEAVLSNNSISTPITYVDDQAPVITELAVRYGSGPARDTYQTGHEYQIHFGVEEDVGVSVSTFDLEYSGDGGESWSAISLNVPGRRTGPSEFYAWTIPPSTPFTSAARVRVTAYDDAGNSASAELGPLTIVDGSAPSVTVTAPARGDIWNIGDTISIAWEAQSPTPIAQTVIYLYHGDQVDVLPRVSGNPGQLTWSVPNSAGFVTSRASVRVRVIDERGNETEASSDGTFEIQDPSTPPPAPWATPFAVTSMPACPEPNCTVTEHTRPSLAVDRRGDVHLAYVYEQYDFRDTFDGPQYVTTQVFYQKRTEGVWGPPEPVTALGAQTSGFFVIRGLSIAVDSLDRPHIAWTYGGSASNAIHLSDLWATRYTGTSWEAPVNVSSNASFSGSEARLMVTESDEVYAVWLDGRTGPPPWTGTRAIHYASRPTPGSVWSPVANFQPGPTLSSDFDAGLGKAGEPQVLFASTADVPGSISFDGGIWSAPQALGTCLPSSLVFPSSAATASGEMDVVYSRYDGERTRIEYAHGGGEPPPLGCTAVSTDNAGQSAGHIALVRHDAAGLPTVVWTESGAFSAVYFRRMTARPASWSATVRINLASQHPLDDALAYAVGPDDVAHVAWVTYVNGHGEVHYNTAAIGVDAAPPLVEVLSPTGGEVLSIGDPHVLRWAASDGVGVASIDVRASLDDGETWTDIATGLVGGVTEFEWSGPTETTEAGRVQVTARDAAGNASSATSGLFRSADVDAPDIALISPAGGEVLEVGSEFLVQWSASDGVGVASIDLSFSTDGGGFWRPVATGLSPGGSYAWTVPHELTSAGRLRVSVADLAGNQASATLATAFAIVSPNAAPGAAFGPTPSDGATGVAVDAPVLSWAAVDADAGDDLTFDVYVSEGGLPALGDLVEDGTSAASLVFGPLSPLTTYAWRVDVADADVTTRGHVWHFTTGPAVLAAPTQLSAWASASSSVELSWFDMAGDETGYEVERKTGIDGSYERIASVAADAEHFQDSGRTGSTQYVYRVRAVRDTDASEYSNEATTSTSNSPPSVPSEPTPAEGASGQPVGTVLTWQGGDPDLGDTVIYRVLLGETPTPPQVGEAAETSFAPADLAYARLYYWRIIATDAQGDSVSSPTWFFFTEPAPLPTPPTLLLVEPVVEGAVSVQWAGESVPNDGVRIERQMGPNGFFQPIASGVTSPLLDSGLRGHESYFYRARTLRGASMSSPSALVPIDVPNRSPRLGTPGSQALFAGEPWSLTLDASDPDQDVLTLSLTDAPAGMSIDGGVVSWQPGAGQAGPHSVTARVDDGHDGVATATWSGCVGAVELCRTGVDEDCDGRTDEGFSDYGEACSVGAGECRRYGAMACAADGLSTLCSAAPGTAANEICDDSLDNDCDERADSADVEDCAGTTGVCVVGETRPCGTDVGACERGLEHCGSDEAWGPCLGARLPTSEICNEIDDDCDGQVDVSGCDVDVVEGGDAGSPDAGPGTADAGAPPDAPAPTPDAGVRHPPNVPSEPAPTDRASRQPLSTVVSWRGGDPDPGDTVTYRVLLGETPTPPQVAEGTATRFAPTDLAYAHVYYWQIIATDAHGDSVSSPIWSFSTEPAPLPTAPTALQVELVGAGSVSLRWAGESVPNDGVRIERRMGPSGLFVVIASGVSSPLLDSGLLGHETYSYRARTRRDGATSAPSAGVDIDVPNQPPQLGSPGSQALSAGEPWSLTLDATDADQDVLTLTLTDAPAGMSIEGSVVSWQPGAGQAGPHSVTARADDAHDGVATATWSGCVRAAERCGTGVDEDCDGLTDEGFADYGDACSVGAGECRRYGARGCAADGLSTLCSAVPGTAGAEVCDDSLDNDCDGRVDSADAEDCADTASICNVGEARACGVAVGICAAGVQRCEGPPAAWGTCEMPVPPSSEVCGNRLDDDCNGSEDDGCGCAPGETRWCGSDEGACEFGQQWCGTDGAWGPCLGSTQPTVDICNGVDDDCDGRVDAPACADESDPDHPDAGPSDAGPWVADAGVADAGGSAPAGGAPRDGGAVPGGVPQPEGDAGTSESRGGNSGDGLTPVANSSDGCDCALPGRTAASRPGGWALGLAAAVWLLRRSGARRRCQSD